MEKSLYFEITKKYFPTLVTQIVEKLNGKRAQQLPYLYRDHLNTIFSADGRWASVTAEYTRVAADVVAMDTELPLKSRDKVSTAEGNIPKLGMKLFISEKQLKDLDNMIAQNLPNQQILQNMFADLPRCIQGVYERIEDMFLSELSTGVALATRSGATGVRLDIGFEEDNKFGYSTAWTDTDNSTPLDDIQKIYDKALLDQNTINTCYLDDYTINLLGKSKQVREQYAFNQGITSNGNVPVLNYDQVASIFMAKWQTSLIRVARTIKTELNGVKGTHTPWVKGHLTFTCNENLGDLVWTYCAEASRPVEGVVYENADQYILASRYSTNDPLREFTSSQAMVIPILNNVDQIYSLDCTTAQG
jgi:hypothetical protein